MGDVSLNEDRVTPPYLIDVLFGGTSRWDGEHYLLIAEHGYKYENNLAFFPLYPILIRYISHTILYPLVYIGIEMHSIMLIAGVCINMLAFPVATFHLYKLTELKFPRSPLLAHLVVLLFILNPANIFMSAVYTECLFSLFSFACIRYMLAGSTWLSCLYLALSCATRSNGTTLCVFIAMHYLESIVTDFKLSIVTRKCLVCVCQVFVGLSPIICYQIYTADRLNYDYTGVLPYSYIQQKHWGIGLLNYYQVKQIPNFLLAAPVVTLSCLALSQEVREMYNRVVKRQTTWKL